jgi:hypothetical protein
VHKNVKNLCEFEAVFIKALTRGSGAYGELFDERNQRPFRGPFKTVLWNRNIGNRAEGETIDGDPKLMTGAVPISSLKPEPEPLPKNGYTFILNFSMKKYCGVSRSRINVPFGARKMLYQFKLRNT